MANKGYTVVSTSDSIYVDSTGKVIKGVAVTINLTDYNEFLSFNVPQLDAKVIDLQASKLVEQRKQLASLS
jgi:hypothetical protein